MKRLNTPNFTNVMIFFRILAFFIPIIVYLLIILLVYPAPNSGFIALGGLGSIIIGLGLVNVVGLVDNLYLGHIITVMLITCGGLFVAASSIVMYTPSIYSKLNEKYITFYFIVWSLLIVSGIYYLFFRSAISLDLRKNGLSKSRIKKNLKGPRNYWWYEGLRDQLSHCWIFSINKLFTILYPSVCLFHSLLGWWRTVSPFILFVLIVLMILNFAMCFLILTTWKLAHFEHSHSNSFSLTILGIFVFPVAAVIGLIIYFIEYM